MQMKTVNRQEFKEWVRSEIKYATSILAICERSLSDYYSQNFINRFLNRNKIHHVKLIREYISTILSGYMSMIINYDLLTSTNEQTIEISQITPIGTTVVKNIYEKLLP